eukprot:1145033-Pelagomonas_calceolata.AAC.8
MPPKCAKAGRSRRAPASLPCKPCFFMCELTRGSSFHAACSTTLQPLPKPRALYFTTQDPDVYGQKIPTHTARGPTQ